MPEDRRPWYEREWEIDCFHWRGRLLTGAKAHWCYDWDYLPVDETTPEIATCNCKWMDEND